jgi:hypothetical protein
MWNEDATALRGKVVRGWRGGASRHLAWLLAFASALACDARVAPRGRVLVVGLDGATLRVARPLLEAGRLPNLARLAREGAAGPLRSLQPLESPRVWNSIATGKTPEKHGILDYTHQDGRLFTSHDRKVHALWNIASDAGLSVAVLNWWNTYPVERVSGVMISDHFFPREVEERQQITGAVAGPPGAVVFPESWQTRLSARLAEPGPPDAVDFPDERPRLPGWMRAERLSEQYAQDAALVRFALEIEAETRPDLLMLLLTGIDRASHVLWAGMEPSDRYPPNLRLADAERAAARATLEGYYEATDRLLAPLLERYGPEDLALVVSDHGFEAASVFGVLTGGHQGEAALHGVLFARGPGIVPGDSPGLVSVLDLTPTILAWLGLPVGADMDGGVARFVRELRVATVPTHDVGTVERLAEGRSGAEEAIVEELRALGYVE